MKGWVERSKEVVVYFYISRWSLNLRTSCAGRNHNRADTNANAASKGQPVTCDLRPETIHGKLNKNLQEALEENAHIEDNPMKKAVGVACRLARTMQEQTDAGAMGGTANNLARGHIMAMDDYVREDDDTGAQDSVPQAPSSLEVYRKKWKSAWNSWRISLRKSSKTPNSKQWEVIMLVHARCVYEFEEETAHRVNRTEGEAQWEPLFRLIHGLPGSGKSQLLKWLQMYFETVWNWSVGVHFQFLAPLNSMAAGIGGQTVHSWGVVRFRGRDGTLVDPGVARQGQDAIEQMHVKCARLRFLFIDEIEATGAGLVAQLEDAVLRGVPQKNSYRYHTRLDYIRMKGSLPRAFGGVNVFCVGDFYQLDPVGSVAFMGNPCSISVAGNAQTANMMGRFWSCVDDNDPDALQHWDEPQCPSGEGRKVLDLDVNHRSGADIWYSDLLTSCREGAMTTEDWQYLHGCPTKTCGSWLARQNRSMCGNIRCLEFGDRTKSIFVAMGVGYDAYYSLYMLIYDRERAGTPNRCSHEYGSLFL